MIVLQRPLHQWEVPSGMWGMLSQKCIMLCDNNYVSTHILLYDTYTHVGWWSVWTSKVLFKYDNNDHF